MPRKWRIAVTAAAGAAIVSTPLVWLLDSADSGRLVGASVQAATGVAGLVWALLQRPATAPAAPGPAPRDEARNTGGATATAGGDATTGVQRPADATHGSAPADGTGSATADGAGSSANTGVRYTR